MVSREQLIAFMRQKAFRPMEAAEIMAALGVPRADEAPFHALLNELETEGTIVRTRHGRYGIPERMNLVVGTFHGHERGFGFVVPLQPGAEHIFIAPDAMGGALHGDRVVARKSGRPVGGRSLEGEVIRVLARANQRIVGTLDREGGLGFVVPDERRIPYAVVVPAGALGGARSGDKVVVEITRWPEPRRAPEGRVVERLGRDGAPGVDILAVMYRYGLPTRFPEEVERQAEGVPLEVLPEDLEGRLDLRDRLVVTIDGEDARDLDDAVSLETVDGPDGARWRLGVHIADVAHYVPEGSALDREARERGTSVYLVDRVVPMLPPRLSNGICSLNPGADRLTLSVFMDFDARGRRMRYEFAASVIRSRARLTYTAVWRSLAGDGARPLDASLPAVVMAASPEEEAALPGVLAEMKKLASVLRERRMRRGSIALDLPEPKVILDASGRPLEVKRAERNLAHDLIEEFMLAANETVAAHCARRQIPCLYRIHEEPEAEKVEGLAETLHNLGIPFRAGKRRPRDFQAALEAARGRPEEALVHAMVLRAMPQARYAADNLGHFGLAAKWYCHFTSPIRRYPDLVVHRVLKQVLAGYLPAERAAVMAQDFPEIARHSSERERRAEEAEMETVRAKMAEWMEGRVGQVFEGTVSGVTAFGIFVQLDNLIEGLVHVSTMDDDYYRFDEEQMALIGERRRRRFRLGDRLRVRVTGASATARQVDFVLA